MRYYEIKLQKQWLSLNHGSRQACKNDPVG
jgi:hypothetical protein